MKWTERLLAHSFCYQLSQNLLGSENVRKFLVREYIHPVPDLRVLDIGCGPADIFRWMPEVDYYGFDASADYIEEAVKRFEAPERFEVATVDSGPAAAKGKFDVVLAIGVLHHLNDGEAESLLRLADRYLTSGGFLLTLDGCRVERQRLIARKLQDMDRGAFVRGAGEYRGLGTRIFPNVDLTIHHDLLRVPFDFACMVARKN